MNYFKGIPFVRTTENVKDLEPSSRLIEALNQEFPRCSHDLELRSFWETEQSKILTKHQYVVPKHSACLNYTNEISDGIDADHRGICKFERPTNPNFQKLRNALAASVDNLIRQHAAQNHTDNSEHLRLLREYLRIREPPEDDLADRLATCITDDTCAWFTTRKDFQNWRDLSENDTDEEAWLSDFILMEAEPGAGKSVLSAQVVHNLQALNHECSYYFLDAQDRDKSSLSRLLRSLAFQMAMLSPTIRHSLLELQKQNVLMHDEDEKSIWRKLFLNCIFRLPPDKQHFWIIDGLDECQQPSSLLQMLLRASTNTYPKIFMTTRPDANVHNEIYPHQSRISHLHLSNTDTQASIKAYVEARTSRLRLRKEQDTRILVQALLDGAEGSFLWVKLTLDNMSKATGPREVMDSLSHIPKGMDHLYSRILRDLERDISDNQRLIMKSVLDWVICSNPPLTVEELEAAVKLDTDSEIFADKMCEVLRNLIFIDHSGKVRPIHQTTRAYLLKPGLESSFAVSPSETHSRIADVLISYLHQRLRNIRNSSQLNFWHQRKQGIDDYALFHFSEHIRRAGSNDHSLFIESDKFFSNSGVSWIACIALGGSLSPIVKTSQNLRSWLQARIKRTPPIGELARKTTRMQQWSIDLGRLIAKFGRHLLECPSAVYMLIPPFLPTESVLAVSRPRPRDLSVIGLKNDTWDDRLCSKFYQTSTCTAVASGKYNFAVALKNGRVYIYDNNTMQLLKTLQHSAVVKLIKYNEAGSQLLTAGFRKLMMWTIPEGRLLWEETIRQPRLAAEFLEFGVLISITSQHKLIKQDAMSGVSLQAVERRDSSTDHDGSSIMFRRELQYAEFSKEAEMLATMQRERPIQLTDMEDKYEIGTIELELSDDGEYGATAQPITAMTFCANIDIALLAAVYRDGILAVFDRDLRLLAKRPDNKGSTLLAGSPNGMLLAAANVEGVITLYNFEELTPLHTLYTNSIENIRSLVFSGDGQRIIDIRDRQANIWTPAVLISRPTEDFHSISESSLAPTIVTSNVTGLKDGSSDVTCIIPCPKADQFFIGREDGSVAVHSIRDAQCVKLLFEDPAKQWTASLTWKANNRVLASLNGTSTIAVHCLEVDWSVSTIFRQTLSNPVKHLFIDDSHGCLKMFVATTKTVDLWTTRSNGADIRTLDHSQSHEFKTDGLWLEDPSGHLILAEPNKVSRFRWNDVRLPDLAQQLSFPSTQDEFYADRVHREDGKITAFDRGASLLRGRRPTLFLRSVSSRQTTSVLPSAATPTTSSGGKRWTVDLSTQAAAASQPEGVESLQTAGPTLSASLLPVSDMIEHVIGIRNDGKQFLFLNKRLWVCSYDWVPTGASGIKKSQPTTNLDFNNFPEEYSRHFFIPDDWLSSNYSNIHGQLLFVVAGAREDCLVFAKKHEVAVIKNPFAYSERVSTK